MFGRHLDHVQLAVDPVFLDGFAFALPDRHLRLQGGIEGRHLRRWRGHGRQGLKIGPTLCENGAGNQ